MTQPKPVQPQISEHWFLLAWALISIWLLICAQLVGGEFGDGYQTIANARYFFGDNASYYVQRGPLAALALWPVELFVGALGLNAVDVRPYHVYSGLLHSAYLFGCWQLLKRAGQAFVPRAIAFAAAILSVVFFAGAPYLSHDLIPGFLYLLLIFLCNRWVREPTPGLSMLLVLIGTAVTFIKQTYALFWISLCVYAALAMLFKWDEGRVTVRRMLSLFGLAGLSGVLSWLGYAWYIGGEVPEVQFLERPLLLISSVSIQYEAEGAISTLFPWDLYLRNLHNYGVATILLVIPGVVFAYRGNDARTRLVAVCWLTSVVVMQLVAFKEVRYLAFLAPLSAVLIVSVISSLQNYRVLLIALLVVVVVDQYRGLSMAAAQITSTPGMNVTRFVGDVGGAGKYVSSNDMSFAYMADSPILRDRYHGIFHVTAEHVSRLNEGRIEVRSLDDPRDLGVVGAEPGDRVLYSNRTLTRRPPWGDNNIPYGMEQLVMSAGYVATITLERIDNQFVAQGYDGGLIMFLPRADAGKQMPLITSSSLTIEQVEAFYGDSTRDTLQVLGVLVDALCQADRCTYN